MGRRKQRKTVHSSSKKNGCYLNDEMDAIQEASLGVHLPTSISKGKNVTTYGNGNGGGYQGSYFGNHKALGPVCEHDGSKVVFEHEGKQLFASSWQGLKEYSGNWDLIIDLAGNIKPNYSVHSGFIKSISTSKFSKALDKFVFKPEPKVIPSEVLALDWNDMGIPPVTYDFWVALWGMLPKTTVIACMGGHGRTGTCLAALMIITGVDYWEALTAVRKDHCSKAVESMSQEKYLHKLYVEDLNRQLQHAQSEGRTVDIGEIEADIKYAEENEPNFTTTTATKSPNAWSSGKQYVVMFADKDLLTKMIDGVKYIKECTAKHCDVVNCSFFNHQSWIEPSASLYNNVNITDVY